MGVFAGAAKSRTERVGSAEDEAEREMHEGGDVDVGHPDPSWHEHHVHMADHHRARAGHHQAIADHHSEEAEYHDGKAAAHAGPGESEPA